MTQTPREGLGTPSDASLDRASPGRGIAWMLLATGAFVTSDTIAKFLLETYPITEVVWVRYVAHFGVVVVMFRSRLLYFGRTNRAGLQLFRSTLLILATILFFIAINNIPLATASAIMFTAPIMVTALSGPFLQETVGPRRWAGVLAGFTGALVIVQPGGSDWEPAMLWALGAAFLYSLYQITTRSLSRTDSSETTFLYTSLIGAGVMSFAVPFAWVTPTGLHALLMISTGLVSGLAHYALIKALAAAPASVVTPLGYTNLIWATVLGYLVFSEFPSPATFLGAAIITLSGVYILRREHMATRSKA